MARPRTPTEVLELRGAFVEHPERKAERENEPEPTGELGEAPPCLTPFQKTLWNELSQLIPPGVAKNSDRRIFELTVRLMAKVRRGVAKVSEVAQLQTCLSRLAMDPVNRSRVHAGQGKGKQSGGASGAPVNPWAKFGTRTGQA
jgi:hypothetical protein